MLSELKGVRIAQLNMVLSKLPDEHCIMMSVIWDRWIPWNTLKT